MDWQERVAKERQKAAGQRASAGVQMVCLALKGASGVWAFKKRNQHGSVSYGCENWCENGCEKRRRRGAWGSEAVCCLHGRNWWRRCEMLMIPTAETVEGVPVANLSLTSCIDLYISTTKFRGTKTCRR